MLDKVYVTARSEGKLLFVAKWDVFENYYDVMKGDDIYCVLQYLPPTNCMEGDNGNEVAYDCFDEAFCALLESLELHYREVRVAITYVEFDVMNDKESFIRDSREYVS